MNEKLYERRAEIAKALAHPTRLKLIDALAELEEECVCELNQSLGVSQPTVSKHLKVLKDAGLVKKRKEGLQVFYSLRVPCVTNFFSCLDDILATDLETKIRDLEQT